MSITLATGPGALISLGLGIGDLATLVGLKDRVGNWMSTSPGDKDLLAHLDIDENDIFQRRGLVDIPVFNKRWRQHIRLLANGAPLDIYESEITKYIDNPAELIEDLSLFSAVFVSIVATLDAFASPYTSQPIIYNILQRLIKPAVEGEDIIRAKYKPRLNSWRSSATLRTMSTECKGYVRKLVSRGIIMPGHMPLGDSRHMEDFIFWLLGSQDTEFRTASSDVAGVADCLSNVGIDVVAVSGPGFGSGSYTRPCSVVYSKDSILNLSTLSAHSITVEENRRILSRAQSITVPLKEPEDSVSIFPNASADKNLYRSAWEAGSRSARYVQLGVFVAGPNSDDKDMGPFQYTVVNKGNEAKRAPTAIIDIARHHAIVVNQELLSGLQDGLGDLDKDTLSWVDSQTSGVSYPLIHQPFGTSDFVTNAIESPGMTDEWRIKVFTKFQAFFMGYYYAVFSNLVDTSSLALEIVEGAWGFRSPDFLKYVRTKFLPIIHSYAASRESRRMLISRVHVFSMLARLFLKAPLDDSPNDRTGRVRTTYIGIIGERALVINSLLGKCRTPQEVGGFTLLDVDVGNIPRDLDGFVRSGWPNITIKFDLPRESMTPRKEVYETGPDEDVTFNIEADWDGDPDTALVCVRFKGRRLASISPDQTDIEFCQAYVPSISYPERRSFLVDAHEVCIDDIIGDNASLPTPSEIGNPLLFQALDKPCLRYTVVALYSTVTVPQVVTGCVKSTHETFKKRNPIGPATKLQPIFIAGMRNPCQDDKRSIKHEDGTVYLIDKS